MSELDNRQAFCAKNDQIAGSFPAAFRFLGNHATILGRGAN